MENNKKQQHFSRPTNSKNIQTSDSKRKTDLQASKPAFSRGARRRDQQSTGPRNDQLRNSKQLPAKQRTNVDKRPRARGGGGGGGCGGGNSGNSYNCEVAEHGIACLEDEGSFAAGSGLADEDFTDGYFGATDIGTIGEFDDLDIYNLQMSNRSGKKKNNLNHLLNFQYARRERDNYANGGGLHGVFGSFGHGATGKRQQNLHKYNKEQFLQANFQFVIKSSAKPNLITSPDTIIDWSLIEQINIRTTEEPRCPICLYPPVAAKLTRCGHAYCWPCILHYLALNDKTWRKCPICYEAIHVGDLKSTAIFQQCQFNIADEITFQLMRRKKGSVFIEKFAPSNAIDTVERYPQYLGDNDLKPFSKILIAKRSDILTIIERERSELLADEDTTCPEYVFVQQAINLLNERRAQLGEVQLNCKEEDENNAEHFNGADNEGKEDPNRELVHGCDTNDDLESPKEEPASDEIQLETATVMNAAQVQKHHYFFYQSIDGQNIFLHPINVKMLQACYGLLENAPLTIKGRILQKECHTMDEELRRKFTCIGHLPLTCQFAVVEVDLQEPIVTSETLIQFKDDIKQRQVERERREREEKKREKKIAAINDRQMGKLISKAANLNLSSVVEFPACGFDFDLMPALGAPPNNFAAAKNIDIKPVETSSAVNLSVTPPQGPSYSAVISFSDASKMEKTSGLFPELSIRGKAKKATTNVSTNMAKGSIANPVTPPAAGTPPSGNDAQDLKSIGTTFGDVMAQAIERKKATTNGNEKTAMMTTVVGKKHKREKKKMLPLFP